jgi:hypothetical protein
MESAYGAKAASVLIPCGGSCFRIGEVDLAEGDGCDETVLDSSSQSAGGWLVIETRLRR